MRRTYLAAVGRGNRGAAEGRGERTLAAELRRSTSSSATTGPIRTDILRTSLDLRSSQAATPGPWIEQTLVHYDLRSSRAATPGPWISSQTNRNEFNRIESSESQRPELGNEPHRRPSPRRAHLHVFRFLPNLVGRIAFARRLAHMCYQCAPFCTQGKQDLRAGALPLSYLGSSFLLSTRSSRRPFDTSCHLRRSALSSAAPGPIRTDISHALRRSGELR